MLVIRLQRTGRENEATYRVVVAQKSDPVKGKFKEIVGHYLPTRKDPELKLDTEKIAEWISKGAIPSNTVARLCKKEGMKDMDKYIQKYVHKKSKNAPEEEPTPPPAPEAPAAPVEEAPAEAPKEEAPVEEKKEEAPAEKPAEEEKPTEEPQKEEAPQEEEKKEEAPAAKEGGDKESKEA